MISHQPNDMVFITLHPSVTWSHIRQTFNDVMVYHTFLHFFFNEWLAHTMSVMNFHKTDYSILEFVSVTSTGCLFCNVWPLDLKYIYPSSNFATDRFKVVVSKTALSLLARFCLALYVFVMFAQSALTLSSSL